MSALWAPATQRHQEPGSTRGRTPLRSVPSPAPRMARFPFLLVLIGVFGLGMAGLLMLNTTLQNQAFDARTLNREATELAYAQADLENQLTVLGAPQELARRASGMGMRTNPYPALVVLPGGKVIGKPAPVRGGEIPSQIVKTPSELAAERVAAVAKAKALAEKKAADEKVAAAKRKAEAAATKEAAKKEKAQKEAAQKEAAQKKAAKNSKKAGDGGQGR